MKAKMYFWTVEFSYLITPLERPSHRENGRFGVIAETIEQAIELINSMSPGSEVKVWSVSHRGAVDGVQSVAATGEEAAA